MSPRAHVSITSLRGAPKPSPPHILPFRRLPFIWLPVLAIALAWLAPISVQSQETTIWSATLTVDKDAEYHGCDNTEETIDDCSDASVLTVDDFTYGGVTYTVNWLYLDDIINTLSLQIADIDGPAAKAALGSLTLHLDGVALAVSDGSPSDNDISWTSFDPDWTDGQKVSLSLTAPFPPPGNRHLIDLKAEAGHQKVTLTWDAASDTEKARVTRYEVQQGTDTSAMLASEWSKVDGSGSGTTTHTVTGLTNGTTYYLSVRAAGPGGAGLASPPVSATPAPEVTKVAVTSTPKSGDTYGANEKVEVTVTFSEAMTVTGVPFLRLYVGGSVQPADYASGSGSAALVFAYTVTAYDRDSDGVSIPQNPIVKIGADGTLATIRNADGAVANTNYPGLSDQSSHKVDGSTAPPDAAAGVGPSVTAMSIASNPASGDTYSQNERIVVEVSWSAPVYGLDDPEPTLNLTIGSSTVKADLVLNVPSGTTFSYTVKSDDVDANGVSIPANPINLASHHFIRGVADDRDAVIAYAGLGDQSGHKVNGAADNAGPTITGLSMFSDGGPYKKDDVIAVRVSFSENIVVAGTPTLGVKIGTNTRTFNYAAKSYIAGSAIFEYTAQAGDSDDDGISVPANSVDVPTGASIKDAAGNNAVVTHAALPAQDGHTVTVGGL